MRSLLAICFAIICSNISAQIKQPTHQVIKTANTLLQAQQYEAAEQYFNKALKSGIASKNSYHQAQAYEGLGSVYSKTGQKTQSIAAYQKSIALYRKLKMPVIADVVTSMLKNVQGIGDLYAGVEIGAKGVKMSVIDVKMGKSGETEYSLALDTAINSDAAALSYQSEKETLDAISTLYSIVKDRYEIPASRVYIVISSGLKQELDKYNKVDYFANIVRPKELDPKIKIRYIEVAEEAELSFKGIVPAVNRLTANQIDVGSGNTKGGYVSSTKDFVPVTFPLGTKSFQRLVEQKIPDGSSALADYRQTAEKMIIDSLGRMIIYQFRDKKDFKSKETVYLSGGIVWCITSLMHPETINQNYVELTLKDIEDFRQLVYNDYDKLVNPEISYQLSAEDARETMRNIKRAVNTYDQKALLTGSIWLHEVMKEINKGDAPKKFIFPRYAYVGWISGYIMDKISKQYTSLAVK